MANPLINNPRAGYPNRSKMPSRIPTRITRTTNNFGDDAVHGDGKATSGSRSKLPRYTNRLAHSFTFRSICSFS